MMVKALCCHSFARQNLFSTDSRATAVTCAGGLAVVATSDFRIRVFDLVESPGSPLADIPAFGKVRCLAVSPQDSFIVALESEPRSNSPRSGARTIRTYRNFLAAPFGPLQKPRPATSAPPAGWRPDAPEILDFSSLHMPAGLALCAASGRLAVSVGRNVWLVSFCREECLFRFDCSLRFDFLITRLDLRRDIVAAASTEEAHVVRLAQETAAPKLDDEVSFAGILKERNDVTRSHRAIEVLGPTTRLDVAAVTISPTAQFPSLNIETLLFKRLPQSHTSRLHSIQLTDGAEPGLLVASTFEGFSYQLGPSTRVSAHYNFTERTLKARMGADGLLHVITQCGLNTFTTRLGDQGTFTVPARFPICLIGSLVWREIHLRTLETWQDGLLLYTEKDSLNTLYSLKYLTSAELFTDMLQMARTFQSDCPTTSCQLMCEAFHQHSLRAGSPNRDKVAAFVEYSLGAGVNVTDFSALFASVELSLEDMTFICEELSQSGVQLRDFVRTFATEGRGYREKVQAAESSEIASYYGLLKSCDPKLLVQTLLLRSERSWLLTHEDVLLLLPSEDVEGILLNCLFLFDTSQLDEIESFVLTTDEVSLCAALKKFSHLVLDREKKELTTFAEFISFIHPQLVSNLMIELCGEEDLPGNLKDCLRALIADEIFWRSPGPGARLLAISARLLASLSEPNRADGCPHRNLRCRQVSSQALLHRLAVLNQLPPFRGLPPSKAIHEAAPKCRCCVCQSHLIRLQGIISWAITSRQDLSAFFADVSSRLAVLPPNLQPSFSFLLEHSRSVPAAFAILFQHAGPEPAETYLRQEAARMERADWMQLLTFHEAHATSISAAANQKADASSANQKALTSPTANQKAYRSSTANEKVWPLSSANQKAATRALLLRLAVELAPPHIGAQLAESVEGGLEAVRAQLLFRYRREIASDLFNELIDSLEQL